MIESTQPSPAGLELKPGNVGGDSLVLDTVARSQLSEFWRSFRRHQMAVIGLVVFILLIIMAVVGPLIVPQPEVNTSRLFELKNKAPSWEFPFGTTDNSKSVFAMVVHGAPISLFISVGSMLVACIVGTTVGVISGYFGGWIDNLLMRIVDVFLSVPLLFVLLMASRFVVKPTPPGGTGGIVTEGAELRSLIVLPVIIGLLTWPQVSRLVRSVTLSVKEQEFVTGARAVGMRNGRIMFTHILPNVINPVVVAGTLLVGGNIVLESFLSYLGFGIASPPLNSWGTALAKAQTQLSTGNWWWAFFPGFFILLTVLAINFIGDGLRDALDPRNKK